MALAPAVLGAGLWLWTPQSWKLATFEQIFFQNSEYSEMAVQTPNLYPYNCYTSFCLFVIFKLVLKRPPKYYSTRLWASGTSENYRQVESRTQSKSI